MAETETLSADEIENGRRLFTRAWTFSRGTPDLDHLPPDDRPEIAFAGRSNVGKSSLINALVGQLRLARASNTPGRTQDLNFFTEPNDELYLVDMPGYGFAEAPKDKVAAWNKVLRAYLAGRRTLLRVFLLVDARHGLKPVDDEIMALLDGAAVSYQVVLTKVDKISKTDLEKVAERTQEALAKHPAAFPQLILTSSEKALGFEELRGTIAQLLASHGS
ncbi:MULTISPECIES: ribosome biogenesis GTP-binding protein YihA/YsxC [unclassified Hyphomicrobium]|uniref:ribosome biogenesis GTP-binding protein YihA/YsxC n=1 Tax=unclassified Hyphomicrobium TaxID=2619925 RepID=UPI000213D425|nr:MULTISPECIES: ribosome biogenesis GTP-binding protein YihA/YsxC [unclassified Hyphomicrobium]CCB68085.1 GTP-binding protein, putative EngB [Hyphomicrobium sp. MC1]